MKKFWPILILAGAAMAQEKLDDKVNAQIRQEEKEHSQAMRTLHMLTDRYGPRLTGSPNHEAAARWAAKQLTEWGFKNVNLEPWDFGHPGWMNERAVGYMTAPTNENLKFEVLGWTPSTKGTVTGSAVQLELPRGPEIPPPADAPAGGRGGRGGPQFQQPTKEQMDQWLAANKDKVRGNMVLIGKAAKIGVNFNPAPLRRSDDQVRQQYDPNNAGRGGGRGAGRGGRGGAPGTPDPNQLTAAQVSTMVDEFLLSSGAAVRINDAGMDHGLIRAFQNRTYDPAKVVPTVVMRNEDYGRIERLLADGENVKLEFNIVNHDYPEGKTSYNVVGEVPGTEHPDEVVMLGGHLDSWHAATGATDNAVGSSMMMEAARIIKALDLKPKRTIRVALWSGEEEGLLGSGAYVKQHFGTFEDPKPDYNKLVAYFNIDDGTGRPRGANIFGPPAAAAALRAILEPLADLGVAGAMASSGRVSASTDTGPFVVAGLPGVNMAQDPIEYNSFTWHSNLDTYERIVPEDVQAAAIVVASEVWHVANRPEMLPRFSKEEMPAAPAGRGGRGAAAAAPAAAAGR
jgi:carboxypeptidase Q